MMFICNKTLKCETVDDGKSGMQTCNCASSHHNLKTALIIKEKRKKKKKFLVSL